MEIAGWKGYGKQIKGKRGTRVKDKRKQEVSNVAGT